MQRDVVVSSLLDKHFRSKKTRGVSQALSTLFESKTGNRHNVAILSRITGFRWISEKLVERQESSFFLVVLGFLAMYAVCAIPVRLKTRCATKKKMNIVECKKKTMTKCKSGLVRQV
jgi:hypothetical protein